MTHCSLRELKHAIKNNNTVCDHFLCVSFRQASRLSWWCLATSRCVSHALLCPHPSPCIQRPRRTNWRSARGSKRKWKLSPSRTRNQARKSRGRRCPTWRRRRRQRKTVWFQVVSGHHLMGVRKHVIFYVNFTFMPSLSLSFKQFILWHPFIDKRSFFQGVSTSLFDIVGKYRWRNAVFSTSERLQQRNQQFCSFQYGFICILYVLCMGNRLLWNAICGTA